MKAKRSGPNQLRAIRRAREVSQMDAAAHLRCGLNRYWKIERGYTEPTDAERKALARLFRVTEAEIFPNPPEAVAS